MSQYRDNLPWFPLFASNMLSDRRYRLMTPLEVAMWIVILMECWSNGYVPAGPAALGKYLGWSTEDVNAGLTDHVLSFFKEADGNLVCPKLEEHWQKHLECKKKQTEGGIEGAKRRYNKEIKNSSLPIGKPIGQPTSTPIGKPIGSLSSIKSNSIKSNSVFKEEDSHDEWRTDFDSASNDSIATTKVRRTV